MNARHYDEWFTAIYSTYYNRAAWLISRMTGNEDVGREIAQEVFIQVYKNMSKLSPEKGSLKYYVLTIARNKAIDYLRKRRVEESCIREKRFEEIVLDRQFYEAIENCYIEGEIISTLHDTINEFPEKEKNFYIAKNLENRNMTDLRHGADLSFYRMRKIEKKINGRIRRALAPFFTS